MESIPRRGAKFLEDIEEGKLNLLCATLLNQQGWRADKTL